jgi:hypothetical protein
MLYGGLLLNANMTQLLLSAKQKTPSGILPYETGEKTWEELSREKNNEAQSGVYALKDTLNRNILLNENDIVFWFTKKGLYRVNKP